MSDCDPSSFGVHFSNSKNPQWCVPNASSSATQTSSKRRISPSSLTTSQSGRNGPYTAASALGKRSTDQHQEDQPIYQSSYHHQHMTHTPQSFNFSSNMSEKENDMLLMEYNNMNSSDDERDDSSDESIELFEPRSNKKIKQVHTVSIKIETSSSSTNSITCSFPFYSISSCHNSSICKSLISNSPISSQSIITSPMNILNQYSNCNSTLSFINIRTLTGQTMRVYNFHNLTLHDLKTAIAEIFQIPYEKQRIVHKGKILGDENSFMVPLVQLGLSSSDSLYVVLDFFNNRKVMDSIPRHDDRFTLPDSYFYSFSHEENHVSDNNTQSSPTSSSNHHDENIMDQSFDES
ncbi:hypothetical protein FDP41_004078 [Naegleria fowleri]|uniref:Ubiquitin-like domain-containing protein n=1 Tax=Naegleria fowleri TaxID=5763 RepID=A0A6A5BG11_NAEFO|nr:uncharacterized protein FDP41_004078 [Naegleria fowleri]KAF0976783.1 hypothetical protein FDP41_004078 [Naegleria fowleri]CAG4707898.1 unnamed protein product [Naegleria fowleri]